MEPSPLNALVPPGTLPVRMLRAGPGYTCGLYQGERLLCTLGRRHGSWRQLWEADWVLDVAGHQYRTVAASAVAADAVLQDAAGAVLARLDGTTQLDYGGAAYALRPARVGGARGFTALLGPDDQPLLALAYGGADWENLRRVDLRQALPLGLVAATAAFAQFRA